MSQENKSELDLEARIERASACLISVVNEVDRIIQLDDQKALQTLPLGIDYIVGNAIKAMHQERAEQGGG
jgi:hypothetical protein